MTGKKPVIMPISGNVDAKGHVTGRSVYVDDIPVMEGMVH